MKTRITFPKRKCEDESERNKMECKTNRKSTRSAAPTAFKRHIQTNEIIYIF